MSQKKWVDFFRAPGDEVIEKNIALSGGEIKNILGESGAKLIGIP